MRNKILALSVIAGLGTVNGVHAEESSWQVKPGLKALHFDNKRQLEEDSVGGSLGLEYQYGRWGTELQVWGNDGETESAGNDVDIYGAYINQYLYFNQGSKIQPYFSMGIGHADFESDVFDDQETQANIGVGVNYAINKQFSLWADVRGIHVFDDSTNDTALGMGVSYRFGASKATPAMIVAPKPVDSDSDGVVDSVDACPNTPAATPVDAKGCALDTDRDGVANNIDQCPNTLKGDKVDKVGCKVKATRVEEIRLKVSFNSGTAQFLPVYDAEVIKLAQFMEKFSDLNVIIEGHTDSSGSEAFNQTLSTKRAQSIKDALVSRYGIAEKRVTVKGYGESMPIASNDTAEGRKENRRVIAALTKTVVQ
ncbi:OmpA family protein [Dasania marina]|uniref:OmpA family protein n=1 Tax=Dasania marina TaxID=471499 RepID=UPI0030DAD317|tara:strand:+ start:26245 stop:27345 length:1101 start_codon:yes stop_codon:yes gene_type:complete